ncbi:hypothetical protein FOL47_002585 [Perkinsus chesapeaki]|uniref:PPM-type phosphatase domain-containing protein n=1 Tax=Perkinsus chesapeaki TaxID=330153 RepID=A0A7J6MCQ9_PERCH|nr:hypothetical protein FOL47_002585 [Perkinsus chesapeaki]
MGCGASVSSVERERAAGLGGEVLPPANGPRQVVRRLSMEYTDGVVMRGGLEGNRGPRPREIGVRQSLSSLEDLLTRMVKTNPDLSKVGRRYSLGTVMDMDMERRPPLAKKTVQLSGGQFEKVAAGVGFCCRKGYSAVKMPNQDSFLVLHVENDVSIYGVFDGHGPNGHEISEIAKENLPRQLIQSPFFRADPCLALKNAFMKTQALLNNLVHDGLLNGEHSGTTATLAIHRESEGRSKNVYVASVGDTRCVSVVFVAASLDADSSSRLEWEFMQVLAQRSWFDDNVSNSEDDKLFAKDLTVDHRPDDPEERERIESNGGEVREGMDGKRQRVYVKGKPYPGLTTSRSLGDIVAHQKAGITAEPYLSYKRIALASRAHQIPDPLNEPETPLPDVPEYAKLISRGACTCPTVRFELDGNTDEVLVICSDGVWENITSDEACEIIKKFDKFTAMAAAERLAEEAARRWIIGTKGTVQAYNGGSLYLQLPMLCNTMSLLQVLSADLSLHPLPARFAVRTIPGRDATEPWRHFEEWQKHQAFDSFEHKRLSSPITRPPPSTNKPAMTTTAPAPVVEFSGNGPNEAVSDAADAAKNAEAPMGPHSQENNDLGKDSVESGTADTGAMSKRAEATGAFNVNDFFGKREQDCRDSCLSDEARDAAGNRLPEAMWMGNASDPSLNTCICYNKDLISDETCETDCGLYGNYIASTPHKEAYSKTCKKMCELIKEMRTEVEEERLKSSGLYIWNVKSGSNLYARSVEALSLLEQGRRYAALNRNSDKHSWLEKRSWFFGSSDDRKDEGDKVESEKEDVVEKHKHKRRRPRRRSHHDDEEEEDDDEEDDDDEGEDDDDDDDDDEGEDAQREKPRRKRRHNRRDKETEVEDDNPAKEDDKDSEGNGAEDVDRHVAGDESAGETHPMMMKGEQTEENAEPFNLQEFYVSLRSAQLLEALFHQCDSPEAVDVHGNRLPDAMFTSNDNPALTCCICFNRYIVRTATCDDDCDYYRHLIKKSDEVEVFDATCRAMCEQVRHMGTSASHQSNLLANDLKAD